MRKVLVIEDDPAMQKYLMEVLGGEYELKASADGIHGIWEIKSFKPDAIVIDVLLPGLLDGLHLVDYIKSKVEYTCIKVAVLSSLPKERLKTYSSAHQADAYFLKPAEVEKLKAWLTHE